MTRALIVLLSLEMLALSGAACTRAGSAPADRALATALAATNEARDRFVDWDRDHQAEIVGRAASLDAGRRALATYRERRAHVVHGFAAAYTSIAAAAAALPLLKLGRASPADFAAELERAGAELTQLRRALAELGPAR